MNAYFGERQRNDYFRYKIIENSFPTEKINPWPIFGFLLLDFSLLVLMDCVFFSDFDQWIIYLVVKRQLQRWPCSLPYTGTSTAV